VNKQNTRDEKNLGKKNRRDTLIIIVVAILLLVPLAFLARWVAKDDGSQDYSLEPFKRGEYVLDDYVTITAYGEDKALVEEAVDAAFQEIYAVEGIADRYKPESEISKVNETAASSPVVVSEDLWEIISAGMGVYDSSGGLFDITMGPLIDVWDVTGRAESQSPPPSQDEITRAMELVGADKLVLDEKARSVYFSRDGMIIDLGGLAKGFAIDKSEKALRDRGVESAIIDMISSTLTIGDKPEPAGGPNWIIAIRNPRGDGYLSTLSLPGDTLISTSGDYQRFFEYEGVRFHHIIDPRTGYPARGAITVTVIGGDSGAWSDAASTAAFVAGYPVGLSWVGGMDGVYVLMVDPGGSVHVSPGLEPFIQSIEEKIDTAG
jgi:thiamine biosynthesis lipoprotein